MTELERHSYDVLVIGAGGAGLRAAIAAHEAGARTAVVCKSLLGKAHTVMAEGGIAAAMGNVWPDDNWKVHFRDTMRGGKMLNNWRMAQLHAQEAPDRVQELEEYGALFDRTPDGLISQRDFGGHRYARLAHVGDRTGLEMIRTLQQRAVELGIDVYMECTITRLLTDGTGETAHGTNRGNIAGAFGYWRETGRFVCFEAPAVILATGGIGKSFKVTSNSWEYSGDGHALAARVGATLLNMEFIQFHPTGMVWPPSVRGILVTESVRGDGGILKNKDGKRFMFDYIPDFFKADTADTEAEADRWYEDKKNNRRPPELLPRDEVARAINAEVKAGRGSPAGGAFLDIASRRTPEYINKRLPSMYHQFKELADVDITKEPMEVGPTCHYIMGGVEVDADTQAALVPGLYAAGEVCGGMHGSNRLGGNSLGDLLVFGQRAGMYAAEYAKSTTAKVADGQIEVAAAEATAPFDREGGENPYALHAELQATMNELVGIIRDADEMAEALAKLQTFKERAKHLSVTGNRQFNPGWHLAIDLQNMLLCSEMVAVAAIERKESRGGHTRNDYPVADKYWGTQNIVLSEKDGTVSFKIQPLPVMPDELKELFEEPK
jgi:succinate dehydrogenase / fumarate reductase flavoprotein subunit